MVLGRPFPARLLARCLPLAPATLLCLHGGAVAPAQTPSFQVRRALGALPSPPLGSIPITLDLVPSGPEAPAVRVLRDDRVATLELDYVAGNPWTPFDLGSDLLGAVGYRVQWWPLHDPSAIASKVSSLRRVQIQPLSNYVRTVVRVEKVNRLGQIVGQPTSGVFHGGSSARVDTLRTSMTCFFDDFDRPEGLPDERKWNTAFSKVNDPDLQAFFINPQFHAHTAVGTPVNGAGDRGQTVHRVRERLRIGAGDTRRLVFDLDGLGIEGRTVWYLDLHAVLTDITSHFSIDGGLGFGGHPSPGLRLRLAGQEISLWGLNAAGEQILLERNASLDWDGVQTFPNVRRAFTVDVSETNASVSIDGLEVLNTSLGIHALNPGDYTVHWMGFGYNTLKVNTPYFLLHWDNFGFDGPVSADVVHNYRTQVAGTDFGLSTNFAPVTRGIAIPDALAPTSVGVQGVATLHFTRQMDTHAPSAWDAADSVTVGGVSYPLPQPLSVASPTLGMSQLISANSPYSTSIVLGTLPFGGTGGTAPLVTGMNPVTFRASQCGFLNVHIELRYPNGSAPSYSPPESMHSVPVHHDFPPVGPSARISHIGTVEVEHWRDHLNDPAVFRAQVSGVVPVRVLVNADTFTAPETLRSNFVSPMLAALGENPGIEWVELRLRPAGAGPGQAISLGVLSTDADCPAPQVVHTFAFDSQAVPNGLYELHLHALDARGVASLPAYSGAGEAAGSAAQLNGFAFPLHIEITNP